jgi:hypothetical protein
MNYLLIKVKIQGRYRQCEVLGSNYNYLVVRVLAYEIVQGMSERYDVPLELVRKQDQQLVLERFPGITQRYQVTFTQDAKFQHSKTRKGVTIKAGSHYTTSNLLVRDGYVGKVFKEAGEQLIPVSLLEITKGKEV